LRYVVLFGAAVTQSCNLLFAVQPATKSESATAAPGNTDQAPKPGGSSNIPGINYLPGSTIKLEQLNGEEDKQLHQLTLSQTFTRYGIQGSDLGKFIHDPKIKPDDDLEGPVIGAGTSDPAAVKGGTYAPYVVKRWTKVQNSELDLYYVVSTWNPYVVCLMKSRLMIA
jgi:hypothetical protein